ncbi:MAG: methionyl-tRNA formyltransferase [Lachnospiraceae bacterium]|nr:methionyl-tRNA formyltransferase [Lachnospiraceae bacterium]
MKIIFMGSPEFAVPSLKCLYDAGHEILAVYTQTDKEKGRGRKVEFPAVKKAALELGLPVYQPKSLRKKAVIEEIRSLKADAIVVAAYGKILPKEVLEAAEYGCFNVHASLLPAYRGAAPVEWAILNGETETGVTIMQMNEDLDTGDILLKIPVPIEDTDTGESLTLKLSGAGNEGLLKILRDAADGELKPEKQPEESPTPYASMLDKEMGRIDFSEDADRILRKIRAFDPWPSAYTQLNGKTLKLFSAEKTAGDPGKAPGEVLEVTKKYFTVNTGNGALKILNLQLEGKKRMDADAFLRGYSLEAGTVLG